MQKWKTDPSLKNCKREDGKKCLDYYTTYKEEFLEKDPLQDWDSVTRCIELWKFFQSIKSNAFKKDNYTILDCGTKDGQFPRWLEDTYGNSFEAIGIEISDEYVAYAQSKGRPVIKGDVCNLPFEDASVDVVFSHHCLGLCPDYKGAFQEMMRVLDKGYLITCNDVPGNPKKHYQYISDSSIYLEWMKDWPDHKLIYFDYWKPKERPSEFVIIAQKI